MKREAWAVYQRTKRITKKPLTEYEAQMALTLLKPMLSNLEVREVLK